MKGERIFLVGVSALTASLLTGCVAVQRSMETQVAEMPPEQRAYVAGSLTVECEASGDECNTEFSIMKAFFKRVGGEPAFEEIRYVSGAGHKRDNSVLDYVRPAEGEKGLYFCLTLVPGDYSLYSFSFWRYAGGGHSFTLREESEFDVPFRAATGEVVFVGDVKLTVATGKNIFGIGMPVPGIVELSPGNDEDVLLAKGKCPQIARQLPMRRSPLALPSGDHPALRVKTEN